MIFDVFKSRVFVNPFNVGLKIFAVNLYGLCLDQDWKPTNPIVCPVLPPVVSASLNYYITWTDFLLAAIFENMNSSARN
jgi:hypothetical protein